MRLGSRFWPVGPATLDWTLDLEKATFGPLALGSHRDDVMRHLGRPDWPRWFTEEAGFGYRRFGLDVQLMHFVSMDDLQLSRDVGEGWPMSFLVKLPGASMRLDELKREDLELAMPGKPRVMLPPEDPQDFYVLEWDFPNHTAYVDIDEQQLVGIGFMVLERE